MHPGEGHSALLCPWEQLRKHWAVYADFQANNAFDVMDRLGEVRVPTLVIGGAQDAMTPPRFVQYLADTILGAQLALLDGAGHYPMIEQADAFNRRLAEFLAALD